MSWPWSQLGLPGPSELSEVRHAYAEKLKTTHPEDDPEGFQRLHSAYRLASRMARKRQAPSPEFREEPESPPEPVRPSPEAGQDFDFERLLAEGEAERAEERRRRGEERRKAQERRWEQERQQRQAQRDSYEQERRDRFNQEQFQWQNTEAILHAIEMMYNSRAGAEIWRKFFQGPMFQQNRGSLDLIFGLEDFVSARPDLSQEARAALFLAYGFDKGVSRPELRPLFQMLLPAWKAERQVNAFPWKSMLWGFLGAFVFLFGIGPVLDSGPVILFGFGLGAVLCLAWKSIKRGKPLRGQPAGKYQRRQSVLRGAACAVMVFVALSWVWSMPGLPFKQSAPDPREQVCRYLEEDYGEEIYSLYNGDDSRFDNVFALRNETGKMFLAGPDGDRGDGKPGYTTNYPEMMVLWRLKEFARNRSIYSVNEVNDGQRLGSWETSGTYLISLNFYGDGKIITDLKELLETMAEEDWYQVRTPEFEVILCSGPLKDGRLILARYKPSDGDFDAQAARQLYEESFAHVYCAHLLRDNELDRDFVHGGTEPYTLTNGGMAELKGEERCRLYGLDGDGQVAMEYYFSTTGGSVCCVPGNFWAEGGQEEDIHFYRLIHVEATNGLLDVYYPWLTAH